MALELGVFAQSGLRSAAPAEILDTTVRGQGCGSSEAGPPIEVSFCNWFVPVRIQKGSTN